MDVGQVNLDKGMATQQRIADGDAGVGEGGRVDDDEIHLTHGLVDAADQLMFGIGLQVFQCDPEFAGVVRQIGDDLIERLAAVDARFPLPSRFRFGPLSRRIRCFATY